MPPGRRDLTPSNLGCALLKPLTWNEDTVGAGGTELEASWAARGSVAGMTSVMILTPPESVTVAAIACGQSGAGEAEGRGPGDVPCYIPAPYLTQPELALLSLPAAGGPGPPGGLLEHQLAGERGPAALCSPQEVCSWKSRQAALAQ